MILVNGPPPLLHEEERLPTNPPAQALTGPSDPGPAQVSEDVSDMDWGSVDSAGTVKGNKYHPKRKSVVEEDVSMDVDNGELGDSESDDNGQESLGKQIVGTSLQSSVLY